MFITGYNYKETEIGLIPEEWQATKLAEISHIQTGPFGSQLHQRDYVDNGTPIITVEHLVGDQITHDAMVPRVSEEDTARLSKNYSLKCGDIVFSRVGSVDRSAYVTNAEDGWLFSGRLLRVRTIDSSIHRPWLDYWLRQEVVKEYVRNIAVGATMPSINTSLLGEVPVYIPRLEEQISMTETLSSLDDKIELNRQINANLEKLASALFKHWFVNFEYPDKNGKPYKSSGGKMTDSELGEIPEGWSISPLSGIADITIGRTPPRMQKQWFSESPEDVKWISIKDMGSAGVYINKTAEYLTDTAVERFNIPVIPKNTIVVSFKLTVGRVAITTESMLSNEAIAHIRQTDKALPTEYVYFYLKGFDYTSLGSTSSIATAVNSQSIKAIPIIRPDAHLVARFENIVKPIFDYLFDNTNQIEGLIQLRESLLPRLMSGKIRVSI